MGDNGEVKSRSTTPHSILKSIGDSLTSIRSRSKVTPSSEADIVYGIEGDDMESAPASHRSGMNLVSKSGKDNQKKSNCCLKVLDGIRGCWATRHTEDLSENMDLFAKTTLRELFTYVIFIILLMIIAFGMSTASIYYFTIANIELYTGSTYKSISNTEEFWTFLENDLVNNLYWEDMWYNKLNNSYNLIYLENQLIGVPQLRQLKINNHSCILPPEFSKIISNCYGEYSSSSDAIKSSFGPGNSTAWTHSITESKEYEGVFGNYDEGGYVQHLSTSKSKSLEIIKSLKDNLWINRETRVIFIDFTIYNANVNLFSVMKLVLEFPPTGGVFPISEVRTVKLLRYITSFDYFVLSCEIFYMIFILYYIIEEIIEIKRHRLEYFKSTWNLLDIFVIVISFVCAIFNVYRVIYINDKLSTVLKNDDTFVDFDFISYWQKIFSEAIAITVFFVWVKIFKYISFNKTMSQLTDTVAHSMKDLFGFCVMFFIFFFAFAQCGFLLFGYQVHGFREFTHSVFTLFRVILGDFNFNKLVEAHHILGPVFFICYVFFVFFILINMFLAIVNDSYAIVKENIAKAKDEFHVSSYLQKQIFDRLKRDKIKKIQEVLEHAEIMNKEQFSFQDWRNELQQHGYADVEIQTLFLQYDNNHDLVLDYEERNQMLRDIKNKKFRLEDNSNQDEGENAENDDQNESNDLDEEVDEASIRDLVVRVDRVEDGVVGIIQKIEYMLEKLSNIEQAKLDHQKNLCTSLDFLSASQSSLRK